MALLAARLFTPLLTASAGRVEQKAAEAVNQVLTRNCLLSQLSFLDSAGRIEMERNWQRK